MQKPAIYVSTFGKKVLNVHGGIPIEVGACKRNNFLYINRDDTGDNISNENEYYGELSGLYWVWKNVNFKDDDIVGYCHYNKGLAVSKRTIEKFFKNCTNADSENKSRQRWIALAPVQNRNHPIPDELDAIVYILKENYPDYYEEWKKQYDKEGAGKGAVCRTCNMFITTAYSMNQYGSFLFEVLGKMRHIVGDKPDADPNMRRYCAFMGERLLSVYLALNADEVLSVNAKYQQWYLNIILWVTRRVKINRNSTIYKVMRSKLGCKSSYGRKSS